MNLNISLQISSKDKGHSNITLYVNDNRVTDGSIILRNAETTPFIAQLNPSRIEIDREVLSDDLAQLLRIYRMDYLGAEIVYV